MPDEVTLDPDPEVHQPQWAPEEEDARWPAEKRCDSVLPPKYRAVSTRKKKVVGG